MHLRRTLWFFPILAVVVALIALPTRLRADLMETPVMRALEPLQSRLAAAASPLSRLADHFGDVSGLEAEKRRLEGEVAQLTSEIVQLGELESENQRLRELIGYRSAHPNWRFLGAEIISRDPSNIIQSAIIDKGSQDGIAKGMTVVSGGSLVGRITEVSETSSKLLFINDTSSCVNAIIQRSRDLGVVKGRIGNRLVMDYLSQDADVRMRDMVVTSGLGGAFPRGLPIGHAVGIRGRDVEPFLQLEIEPLVDCRKLESVMVILNFSPTEL